VPKIILNRKATVPLLDYSDSEREHISQTLRFRHPRLKRVALGIVCAVLLTGLASAGWVSWKLYSETAKVTGSNNPLQLLSVFTLVQLKQTNGRTNILLAGYSVDDAGHAGAALTDSIMVLSYDQKDKSAVVISIPRDLWVNIPGFGYSKINAAYEDGQSENFSQSGYPNGGMGLLEEVIQQNFGIQFNYYTVINYTALKSAVNAVGGIDVNIQSSDSRGIYDPSIDYTTGGPLINLTNGLHHLSGQEALDLARARGDAYGSYGFPEGDFNRTAYQQGMLLALKDKASSTSVIANPLKIGKFADSIGNNVQTDLKINEMETLYTDTKKVSNPKIKRITFNNVNGQNLLSDYLTSDGQEALVPRDGIDNYTAIQSVINSLLVNNNQ